ncbi:MAG TPA: hypothetical protein VKL61_09170 [Candidatus Polarisedimenticolia bacterium]|nr:hypothetical protein [Candidatus Polarisedimenticolia bacterium]
MSRRGRRAVAGIGLLGGMVLGGTAMARPDLYFDGSLSLAGVQDDNLFYTAESPQRDVISRLTPGIEAGSRSERLTLSGRWSLDAERFADHSELDTNRARESAAFDLHSRLSRPLSLSLHGDYLSTLTPGELNPATGLAAGRSRARRLSVRPSLDWKLGPTTVGTFGYTRMKDDLVGGVAADTRSTTLGLDHHPTPRDTLSTHYDFSRYRFEEGVPIAVHTLTFGWERRVGPHGSFELRAGPRYSLDRFDPEASLALQRGGRRVDTSLTVARSLTTVIGQAGTFVTDSVLTAVSYRPVSSLRLSATPGVYWIRDSTDGPETRVYLVGLEGNWRISDWLSLVSSYHMNRQRGGLVAAAAGTGVETREIARNTFFLGLVAGRTEPRAPAAAGRSEGGMP